jgi:hypothetical protein
LASHPVELSLIETIALLELNKYDVSYDERVNVTIPLFVHLSGAMVTLKRTGSLTKLQKAMGHSSLAVSLTYLRGLEVSELEESDMPLIQ